MLGPVCLSFHLTPGGKWNDRQTGPNIYNTNYYWWDVETFSSKNSLHIFRIIVSARKGELANIEIGMVENPDYEVKFPIRL